MWVLLFFLILCIWVLFTPLYPALTIMDGKSKQLVFLQPINLKEPFSLQYIHSIHKTPIVEQYYLNENLDIVLDSVTYESFGVGTPSTLEPGQTFTQRDGKYIINNMNREFPYFDQAIGQVIANHQLLIDQKIIPLSSLTAPGNWVRFQGKKVSLLTLWKEGAPYDR